MTTRAASPVTQAMRTIRADWRKPAAVKARAQILAALAVANQPIDPHPTWRPDAPQQL